MGERWTQAVRLQHSNRIQSTKNKQKGSIIMRTIAGGKKWEVEVTEITNELKINIRMTTVAKTKNKLCIECQVTAFSTPDMDTILNTRKMNIYKTIVSLATCGKINCTQFPEYKKLCVPCQLEINFFGLSNGQSTINKRIDTGASYRNNQLKIETLYSTVESNKTRKYCLVEYLHVTNQLNKTIKLIGADGRKIKALMSELNATDEKTAWSKYCLTDNAKGTLSFNIELSETALTKNIVPERYLMENMKEIIAITRNPELIHFSDLEKLEVKTDLGFYLSIKRNEVKYKFADWDEYITETPCSSLTADGEYFLFNIARLMKCSHAIKKAYAKQNKELSLKTCIQIALCSERYYQGHSSEMIDKLRKLAVDNMKQELSKKNVSHETLDQSQEHITSKYREIQYRMPYFLYKEKTNFFKMIDCMSWLEVTHGEYCKEDKTMVLTIRIDMQATVEQDGMWSQKHYEFARNMKHIMSNEHYDYIMQRKYHLKSFAESGKKYTEQMTEQQRADFRKDWYDLVVLKEDDYQAYLAELQGF